MVTLRRRHPERRSRATRTTTSTARPTYLVVGLLLMVALSRIDYARLRQLKNGIYALLMLSILAVLGIGHTRTGAPSARSSSRCFSFQASELGKVLLILALSAFVVDRARQLRERDTTVRVMLAALVPAMFVIAQPDLGSGLVYMVIAFMLLFVAGTSVAPARGAARARSGVARVRARAPRPAVGVHVLKPYQAERLTAFLHPSTNSQKQGYQQQESKIAIGVGTEDRPRRERHPDPLELRARERHRLHLRRRRRAVRLRRARRSCCRSTRC